MYYTRRSETDILRDLLSAAQQDIKKTRLIYEVNMAYSQFTKYLDYLLERDVIGVKHDNPGGKMYYLTDKDKVLLESLDIVLNYLE
jgi:predicted transcriptional regulator